MDLSLFGFNFGGKKKEVQIDKVLPSIIQPEMDDGTAVASNAASYYGYYVDMDGTVKDEIQAIQKYREISLYSDVDIAIQDIINEAIPYEDDTSLVEIVVEKLDTSDEVKNKIIDEFKYVLRLLKFNEKATDIFRKWYVDGRLYYNVIVDENPRNGIVEVRPIEATKIKKIVELIKDKTAEGVEVVKGMKEYYVYSQNGFVQQAGTMTTQASGSTIGVKMSPDSVIYTPSGFIDQNTGAVLSYLQKALRPANQLRMLEDAVVIYRLSRAPERRIFYIDVGNLPKAKAEQYVKDIMNRYRNKLVYDAKTGEIRDDKKYMSMLEDFWMPRRDGNKGTEITTLQGGQNLGELTDVNYFQEKLYNSLNIPLSRIKSEGGFNFGKSTEITRDEVKFQKFIGKIRRKFSELFFDLLKTQLKLKNIINDEDWEEIKELIVFRFQKDNFFAELKNQDLLMNRLQIAQQLDTLLGKYFSVEKVRREIFMMTDDEIEELDAQMKQEYKDHPYWYQAQQMAEQQQQMAAMQQEQGFADQEMGQYNDQQQQQMQQNQNQGA